MLINKSDTELIRYDKFLINKYERINKYEKEQSPKVAVQEYYFFENLVRHIL